MKRLIGVFDPSTTPLWSDGLVDHAISFDNAAGSLAQAAHGSELSFCAGGIDGFKTLAAALVAHGFRPLPRGARCRAASRAAVKASSSDHNPGLGGAAAAAAPGPNPGRFAGIRARAGAGGQWGRDF